MNTDFIDQSPDGEAPGMLNTVDPLKSYASTSMLYDSTGSRGFLRKYPQKRSLMSSIMRTNQTFMRYFMLDFHSKQLVIFSDSSGENAQ